VKRLLPVSLDRFRFLASRIGERLWIKPLVLCLLSIGCVFLAKWADSFNALNFLPQVSQDSVEALLSIMASSMLVIATFAVGSMVAAYASASTAATPRSIPLVIADDVTQNAMSAFVGAFIFSLVALITVKHNLFGTAGLFAIFSLTILVFSIVIITFVRWVDRIARLGQVVNTIQRVEEATADALQRIRSAPTLRALPLSTGQLRGVPCYSSTVGYVQHIDIDKLQRSAQEARCQVTVVALPGSFVSASRALLRIESGEPVDCETFLEAFTVGRCRTFEDDPRFGLLALSEIADKALSPGVNDAGTAINVIGTMVRLFTLWQAPLKDGDAQSLLYPRVSVPELVVDDMFDDAFTAIARDGAGVVEVVIRLQKAFHSLSETGNTALVEAAKNTREWLWLARNGPCTCRRTSHQAGWLPIFRRIEYALWAAPHLLMIYTELSSCRTKKHA